MGQRFICGLITVLGFSLSASANGLNTNASWTTMLNASAGYNDIKYYTIERIAVEDLNVKPAKYLSYVNDCTGLGKDGGLDSSVTPVTDDSSPKSKLRADGEIVDVRPKTGGPATPTPTPAPTPGAGPVARDGSPISLEQIVNLGEKIWKFLTDNKPVVTARTIYANALPRGIQCWDELESWQRPRSEVYKASYYNGFNAQVVSLEFRLVYTWGGKVDDVGNYLTNVSVQYKKLDVMPFFNVDAEVEVPQVVNVGKRKAPIAGMQVSVRWKVRGLNHVERTASFFVYGDGRKSDVLQ